MAVQRSVSFSVLSEGRRPMMALTMLALLTMELPTKSIDVPADGKKHKLRFEGESFKVRIKGEQISVIHVKRVFGQKTGHDVRERMKQVGILSTGCNMKDSVFDVGEHEFQAILDCQR